MKNNKEDFRRVLDRVDELPPISSVFFKIISLTESKESSREELIRCISLDQSIAAKVLQTINSAYFGKNHSMDPELRGTSGLWLRRRFIYEFREDQIFTDHRDRYKVKSTAQDRPSNIQILKNIVR